MRIYPNFIVMQNNMLFNVQQNILIASGTGNFYFVNRIYLIFCRNYSNVLLTVNTPELKKQKQKSSTKNEVDTKILN